MIVAFLPPMGITQVNAQTGQGVTQWGQYHGDEGHAGFSSSAGPTSAYQPWTYSLGGATDGIVASNGNLVGDSVTGTTLVALSESTGSQLFSYALCSNCGGANGLDAAYPAVSGSSLFYAWHDCCRYRIASDSLTGSPVWSTNDLDSGNNNGLLGSYAISFDNGLVFASPLGTRELLAISGSTGQVVWKTRVGGSIDTIPTVGNGVVAVGYANASSVTGVSTSSGSNLWNFPTDSTVDSAPAYSNGDFFFGSQGGTVYSVSSGGSGIWQKNLGSGVETTPAVANGVLFVGTDSGVLFALDSSSGSVIWSKNLGSQLISPPVVSSNSVVYEASTGGGVYALNATSGLQIWHVSLNSGVSASPVLDNGYLFILDQNGVIHAFTNGGYIGFTESGLPGGTVWGVLVNGQVAYSSSNSVTVGEVPGTYSYQVLDSSGRWFASWYDITDNGGDLGGYLGASTWTGYNFSYSWSNIAIFGGQAYNVGFLASQTINVGGSVKISISHDDGMEVYIDGAATFGGAGLCQCPGSASTTVNLVQGLHKFVVKWYNIGGPGSVSFSISPMPQELPVTVPNPSSGSVTVSSGNQSVPIRFTNGKSTVTFQEKGLPLGISWQVTLGGETLSSTLQEIAFFNLTNGQYAYSIGNALDYAPTPASGSVNIAGSNLSVTVTFTRFEFDVVFTETGLPSGAVWQVVLDGTARSSSASTIDFPTIANGQHSFTVSTTSGYEASPASGSLTVAGANTSVSISFVKNAFTVTFDETGLPSGLTWSVTVDSTTRVSSSGSVVFVMIPKGSHTYTVTPPYGYVASPTQGNFTISGLNLTLSISFALGWTPSSAPQDLVATGSVGYVRLTWGEPSSSGAPPGFTGTAIEFYYIYKGNSSGSERYYSRVSGSTLSYTDSEVVAGQIYFYEITAVNPAGQSPPSTEASGQAVFITVPSVVSKVLPIVENSGILVTWQPPQSNGGTTLTGYLLCRGSTPQSIVDCVTLSANRTSYLDTQNLTPGDTYYYTVKALNSQGQGDPSAPVQQVAPESPSTESPIQVVIAAFTNPSSPNFFTAWGIVAAVVTPALLFYLGLRIGQTRKAERKLEKKEKKLEKKEKKLEKEVRDESEADKQAEGESGKQQ